MEHIERFINYAKINTQSDDTTGTTPSTMCQKDLGRLLVKELLELGLEDAHMDEYGNVYAHLKGEGNTKIGLNAHMDTALEVSGENVKPRIIKNFDGNDIKLNEEYTLSIKEFPSLKNHINHDLVVTDGTTLLGADDKAGIAIIMSVLEELQTHPEIKHKNISISFTVDEEIGEGHLHFDVKKMDADFAYTLDGDAPNGIDFENFNAKGATIKVQGVSIHPGEGKGALINAVLVMNYIINHFPKDDTPFEASEDDGYWHINELNGTSDNASLKMIIRDFENEGMDKRVKAIENAVEMAKKAFPKAIISLDIVDQYQNMKPYVVQRPEVLEVAEAALRKNGLTPRHTKIRGGTDGASFSKKGLVTPNLGTGSYNHHGRYEYVDIQEFEKMIDVVLDIVKL